MRYTATLHSSTLPSVSDQGDSAAEPSSSFAHLTRSFSPTPIPTSHPPSPPSAMTRRSTGPLLLLASLLVLLLSLPFTSSLLSSSLTPSDLTRITSDLHAQLPFDDAASLYAYTHTLTLLGQPIPDKAALTSTLQPLLSSRDVSEVHSAAAALALLGQKPSLPPAQLATLNTALSAPNLLTVYHAASTLVLLSQQGSASLKSYDIGKALTTLASLEELDHTHRLSVKTEDGSVYNTALVYDLLAKLAKADSTHAELAKAALGFSDEVFATDHGYGLPTDVSQPQAVGALIAAIGRLGEAVKTTPPLTAKQTEEAATYLLANRYATDPVELDAVLDGLHALAALPAQLSPLSVSFTDAVSLTPRVTDVLGKVVKGPTATTTIKSAAGEAVASGKWASATPGGYSVQYDVDGRLVSYAVKRTGRVRSVSCTVSVTDSAKESDSGTTVTHPNPMPHPFTADGSHYVQVKVAVDSDISPSQVVTLLTRSPPSNGTSSTPFTARKAADGSFTTKINVGSLDVLEAVGGGGSFVLHILVGDALLAESIDWPVADLELVLPRLAPSTSDSSSVIVHTFRPVEQRHSYVLPLLFTLAQVAAFAALMYSVLRMTSIEMPQSPVEWMSASLFQLCLAALIGLYALYWFRLNIFQALTGSIVLAIAAMLTGNQALTALHIRKGKVKTS